MKRYPKSEHGIEIGDIDKDALYILDKLHGKDFEAYLVGGSIRDLLLGHKPKDFDITTSASPEEIKQVFPRCLLIGRRFRLAHVRFGRKIIEVSTFRSGDIESEELIVHDNEWGSAEEDVIRRDFTINGLLYDSRTQEIIDYVGGVEDAKKKCLRAIGQPYMRFKQDPVRMIRLIKFQARFGLDAEAETGQALLECRSDITKSSPARVLEELLRMLESGHAEKFFRLMTDRGLIQMMLPDLSHFLEHPDGSEIYDYLNQADQAILENPSEKPDRTVLLSCLVFPLFDKHLSQIFNADSPPHLGEIFQEADRIVQCIFWPFLQLPRRLRVGMGTLLTSQYRIIPFGKTKKQRVRLPRVPEFSLALDFFRLRAGLDPLLQEPLKEWEEALARGPSHDALPSYRPRRYRR
ncbi:MAG: polynucleotide adenylyltransferase PcnB [Simkaniaceae bacterium]|nr:polynucleotide adenylyltransferase PcnB [Simkaniaceae bacterium]